VPIAVGALLIEKGAMDNRQYCCVAYLDVRTQCGLIAEDKAAAFQEVYKHPDEFCCLLVADTDLTNLVCIPFPGEVILKFWSWKLNVFFNVCPTTTSNPRCFGKKSDRLFQLTTAVLMQKDTQSPCILKFLSIKMRVIHCTKSYYLL
jgi:hypothetical protein